MWRILGGLRSKSWSVWVVYLFFVNLKIILHNLHPSTFYTFDEGFWLMNSIIMEGWRIWRIFLTLTKKSLEIQTNQLFQWRLAIILHNLHSTIRQGLRPHHQKNHEHTHTSLNPPLRLRSLHPRPSSGTMRIPVLKNEIQKPKDIKLINPDCVLLT